jgi:hypothetical protein
MRSRDGALFWAMDFGHDAVFFTDLGPVFTYLPDPVSNQNQSQTNSGSSSKKSAQQVASFPSLQVLLELQWTSTQSRLFPLNRSFVKSRLLCLLRAQLGRPVEPSDAQLLQDLYEAQCRMQGLDAGQALLSAEELHETARLAQTSNVMACSVLGSVLAQECIKAVTHVGAPCSSVTVFSARDLTVKSLPAQVRVQN